MVFSSHALEHFFGRHDQPVVFHRDLAMLDVPIAGELVPADLDRPGDQVRFVDRLAGGLAFRFPGPLHRHSAQHGRFAGAGRRTTDRVGGLRRVPQIGQHVDAAGLDFGGLRILVLVDHVLVHALVHQSVDFGLGPGLAEGRQVLTGVAVEHQFVMDDRIGMSRILLGLRKLVFRHRDRKIDGSVNIIVEIVAYGVLVV